MLHRFFQRKPSQKSVVEGYIRRILYMYKTEMEDTFCTHRFSLQNLHTALEGYGLKPTDYFLQIFHTNCAVFLYNKKKNRYERVQRRFMENDIVCALRPTASTIPHGTHLPHVEKIHDQEATGDHWIPEYVYHYQLPSS